MILVLPAGIVERLTDAVSRGGRREVGGVLMGQHVDVDTFRVADLTVQMKGGTFAAFVRLVEGIIGPLRSFFQVTKHDYTRFNYLGEWHSHHSFALTPSDCDHRTMIDIVTDPDVGARFAVLLLVKVGRSQELEHAVTVYRASSPPVSGMVVVEPDGRAME
jgi:proteasome lid subunit RPN8/RPN11